MGKGKGWTALGLAALGLAAAAWAGREHVSPLVDTIAAKPAPEAQFDRGKKAEGKQSKSGSLAAPVTAAVAITAEMPVILVAPGTVEPLATVAIKPRVDGQIVEVNFREGDLVQEGQVLFRLDDRLMKAQIQLAEANIARDEANLRDAESTLQRREALVGKKYVSEALAETARHTVEGLKAAIAAGRAQLEMQKTQLDYLVIRAPITGRTGSIGAKLGATVRTQDSQALVTINQTRPIAVSFSVPQTELGQLMRALASKSIAEIVTPGSQSRKLTGTIGMIDNQVDKSTGTVQAKVIVENTEEALWPGQAVEVALIVEKKPNMTAVPASAVLPAQQGMLVWVIDADNKVAPRIVTVEQIVGQTAYLQDGLRAGERVVTDGQIRLAPGVSVNVQEPRSAPATTKARLNERS
ncbi:MAG: efflux RND transporter periplasmic adaptor subunit [Bacteroidota bacterium]|jgi:multidrug efflux system membrane fusion protein